MIENSEIISDEVANLFSNLFEKAIYSLGIKINKHSNENYGLNSPVEIAIKKFEQHQVSILLTKILLAMKALSFLTN